MKFAIFSLLSLLFAAQITAVDVPPCSALLSTPYLYQSVNVITGDYCEAHTDATIHDIHSLKIRRCFSSTEGWHFNLPLKQKESFIKLSPSFECFYDHLERLSSIISAPTSSPILQIAYEGERDPRSMTFSLEDGHQLHYELDAPIASRYGPAMLINKVLVDGLETCHYHYRSHPTQRQKLISLKQEPEGRYTINEYYDGVENLVGDATVTIHDPISDPRIGRVKLQKGPVGSDDTPIITSRFFYHPEYTEVFDALNRKIVYRYHKNGYLIAIEHYMGAQLYRTERMCWQQDNTTGVLHLIAKVWEDGEHHPLVSHTFDYDHNGNLVKETLYGNLSGSMNRSWSIGADGRPTDHQVECYSIYSIYTQEPPFLLASRIEDNGKVIQYVYDDHHRLSAEFQGDAVHIDQRRFFDYDGDGLLKMVTIDDGSAFDQCDFSNVLERKISCFEYSPTHPHVDTPTVVEDKVLDITTGSIQTVKRIVNTYTAHHQLYTQHTYDSQGALIHSTTMSYDSRGHLIGQCDHRGNREEYAYDRLGNKTYQCLVQDQKISEVQNSYDLANRLIHRHEIDKHGVSSSISYRYNYAGDAIATTDKFGNTTEYTYDDLSRIVKIVYPPVRDAEGYVTMPTLARTYDIFGNITSETDANGHTTTIRYNIRHQPTERHHPDGTCERWEYFLDGFLKSTTSPNGTITNYERDRQGRPTKITVIDPSGEVSIVTTHRYSAFHLLETTEQDGTRTCYSYDAQGRLIQQEVWNGHEHTVTMHRYDSQGNLISSETYDSQHNLLPPIPAEPVVEEPHILHQNETTVINHLGQQVPQKTATMSDGTVVVAVFDALYRCVAMTTRNSFGDLIEEIEMDYDPQSNLIRKSITSNMSCQVDEWRYDPCNRLVASIQGVNTPSPQTTHYHYTYDKQGQLVGAANVMAKPKPFLMGRSMAFNAMPSQEKTALSTRSLGFFSWIDSVIGFFQQFKKDYSYEEYIKDDLNYVVEQFFGTGFLQLAGYYQDKTHSSCYNPEGAANSKIKVTMINGILNVKNDIDITLGQLSGSHGNVAINYVFHATEGWSKDILNCFLVKMGVVSSQARLLAKTWKQLIHEMGGTDGGGTILHYAHSIGATDTYMAKNLLTPEEQRLIHVITMGSPSINANPDGFGSVIHYASKRDGVCLLDPVGYFKGWFSGDSNVQFVGSFWGIPFIEHTLNADCYSELIKLLGEQFINTYNQ